MNDPEMEALKCDIARTQYQIELEQRNAKQRLNTAKQKAKTLKLECAQLETQTEALDQDGDLIRSEMNAFDQMKSTESKNSLKDFDAFGSKLNLHASMDV